MQQNASESSSNQPGPRPSAEGTVRVAVAIVYRRSPGGVRLFVARRPDTAIRGGLWEFPGGKIEPGEAAEAAALRELSEEVGLAGDAIAGPPWHLVTVTHTDPALARERSIALEAFLVEVHPHAEPRAHPSVEVRWIGPEDLGRLPWPKANEAINDAIRARFGR